MYNKCILIGNVANEPELRATTNGTWVLKFRLACNERYKSATGEWKEKSEFIPIVMFGNRSDALSKVLQKGGRLMVEGSFTTRSYDKDGEKRFVSEISAKDIVLLGGNGSAAPSPRQSKPEPTETYEPGDGIPF